MSSFEFQKSLDRKEAARRAFAKTIFIKKAIDNAVAIHEDRKQ